MKHSKTFLLLLITIFAIGNVYAYEQKGCFKSFGRYKKAGKSIANVSIYVNKKYGNSTKSDDNGVFSLTLKGEKFVIDSVRKRGYSVTYPEDVYKSHYCSKNDFVIYLTDIVASSKESQDIQNKQIKNLNKTIKNQYKQIDQLKSDTLNKSKLLEDLNNKWEIAVKLLPKIGEEYARINFDLLDEFDQEMTYLTYNYELERADSLLKTQGDLNQRRAFLDSCCLLQASGTSSIELDAKINNLTTKLASDYKHRFNICRFSLDFDSAAYYIKERASLFNSTNIDFLNEAGDFFIDYACIYDEALLFYEKALEQTKKEYGENHVDVARFYNNIASVYDTQGKYDEALELYNKALDILKPILSEKHVYVATSYNNIAMVYDTQGKYDEALELYNKALKIRLSILGENHVDVATSYNNIAMVYDKQGKYDEALELLYKALDIYKSILGENHVDVATSYNNIASIYNTQGKYDEALELYNKALNIYQSILGENHVEVATTYNNIASAYYSQGKYDEAL